VVVAGDRAEDLGLELGPLAVKAGAAGFEEVGDRLGAAVLPAQLKIPAAWQTFPSGR